MSARAPRPDFLPASYFAGYRAGAAGGEPSAPAGPDLLAYALGYHRGDFDRRGRWCCEGERAQECDP